MYIFFNLNFYCLIFFFLQVEQNWRYNETVNTINNNNNNNSNSSKNNIIQYNTTKKRRKKKENKYNK